jgi:hypothetical protein
MDYLTILQEEIIKIATYYNPNELAYLALTSKVENTLRDKLTYRLQERLVAEHMNLLSTKEWQEADIAILTPDYKAEVLIFLKSGVTADETKANESMIGFYPKKAMEEAKKSREIVNEQTRIYLLLFYVHQNKTLNERYKKITKNNNAFQRAFKNGDSAQISAEAKAHITHFFSLHNLHPENTIIEAGQYWDINVQIHSWLTEIELQ